MSVSSFQLSSSGQSLCIECPVNQHRKNVGHSIVKCAYSQTWWLLLSWSAHTLTCPESSESNCSINKRPKLLIQAWYKCPGFLDEKIGQKIMSIIQGMYSSTNAFSVSVIDQNHNHEYQGWVMKFHDICPFQTAYFDQCWDPTLLSFMLASSTP